MLIDDELKADFAKLIGLLRAAGYAIVPIVPTDAMQDAGNDMGSGFIQNPGEWNDDAALNIWKAMINAA